MVGNKSGKEINSDLIKFTRNVLFISHYRRVTETIAIHRRVDLLTTYQFARPLNQGALVNVTLKIGALVICNRKRVCKYMSNWHAS